MLPDNTYSSLAIPSLLMDPDTRVTSPLVDYELGGTDLNNASQGMRVKVWMAYLDGYAVKVKPAVGGTTTTLFTRGDIIELACAFDQNMRPAIAFLTTNQTLMLYWYDSVPATFVFTSFGPAVSPRLSLDDKRRSQLGSRSDILLAYIRDNALHYRQQRDRFTIERTLQTGFAPGTRLRTMGMGKGLRMQFELILP